MKEVNPMNIRRLGRPPGVKTVPCTVKLDPDMVEWAKEVEGLSQMLRRLMEQEKERTKNK
jgi:hypothetical protein